jgi:hypothetical protein
MASDEASEERSQEKVDAAAAEGDDAKEAPVPERVRFPVPSAAVAARTAALASAPCAAPYSPHNVARRWRV